MVTNAEQVRKIGAQYWQPVISVVAAVLAGLNVLGLFRSDDSAASGLFTRWTIIGIAIAVVILIRFPRVAAFITRLIFPPRAQSQTNLVFRGLRPYTRDDGENLPGRKADVDECHHRMREPFFVLDGETGCGKSSILNAALIPGAEKRWTHVVRCRITDDPFRNLLASLCPAAHSAMEPSPAAVAAAADRLVEGSGPVQPGTGMMPLLLVLDQFEELFVNVGADTRREFAATLRKLVARGGVSVTVVIRTDFLDLFLKLCRDVDPEQEILNLGNFHTLTAFSRGTAKRVVEEILAPATGEDPVREPEIKDFAEKLVDDLLRPPRDSRLSRNDPWTVLPAELQCIGQMLESTGAENLSIAGYRRLGGKAGLMRRFIEDTKLYVLRRTGIAGEHVLLLLRELISTAGTKQPRSVADLRRAHTISALSERQIQQVLEALCDRFLLNRLPGDEAVGGGGPRYELLHEHLITILSEAPDPFLQRARDANERIAFWLSRTKALTAENEPAGGKRSWWTSARLSYPIPVVETLRLWRFASTDEARRMLRRNITGFAYRCAVLLLPLVLVGAGRLAWVNTDDHQRGEAIRAGQEAAKLVANSQVRGDDTLFGNWVVSLACTGNFEEAGRSVRELSDDDLKTAMFASAAMECVSRGRTEAANRLTRDMLTTSSEDLDTLQWHAAAVTAGALARGGEPEAAKRLPRDVQGLSRKALAYGAVADGLATHGMEEGAREAWDSALAVSRRIAEPTAKASLLLTLSRRAMRLGFHPIAAQAAGEALRETRKAAQSEPQAALLLECAEQLVRVGAVQDAHSALRDAVELYASGRESSFQVSSVTSAVSAFVEAGQSRVIEGIADSVRAAGGRPGDRFAESFRTELVVGLAVGGDSQGAMRHLDVIRGTRRPEALVDISRAMVAKGDVQDARTVIGLMKSEYHSKLVISPTSGMELFLLSEELFERGARKDAVELASWASSARAYSYILGVSHTVAVRYARLGNADSAMILARMHTGSARCEILSEIGEELLKKRRHADALAAYREYMYGEESRECLLYSEASAPVIAGFVRAGRPDTALTLLRSFEDMKDRTVVWGRIAVLLAMNGQGAKGVWMANRIQDSVVASLAFASIVEVLARSDGEVNFEPLLRKIYYDRDRSLACGALAAREARAGRIRPAADRASECPQPRDRLPALTLIVERLGGGERPPKSPAPRRAGTPGLVPTRELSTSDRASLLIADLSPA